MHATGEGKAKFGLSASVGVRVGGRGGAGDVAAENSSARLVLPSLLTRLPTFF